MGRAGRARDVRRDVPLLSHPMQMAFVRFAENGKFMLERMSSVPENPEDGAGGWHINIYEFDKVGNIIHNWHIYFLGTALGFANWGVVDKNSYPTFDYGYFAFPTEDSGKDHGESASTTAATILASLIPLISDESALLSFIEFRGQLAEDVAQTVSANSREARWKSGLAKPR